MNGDWKPLARGYHVSRMEGPAGDWQIAHAVGRLTCIDPTGRGAGTVTKIEPIRAWN